MSINVLVLILVILLLVGGLPVWPYSNAWGYGPSGVLLIIVIVLVALSLRGGPV
jgi:Protein of unknown function (DUF3309)